MTTIPRALAMAGAAFILASAPAALAQSSGASSSMPGMDMPQQTKPADQAPPAAGDATPEEQVMVDGYMPGALGGYPMAREASGTSWQPDESREAGVMTMSGDWMIMSHALIDVVADHQGGARGGDKTFLAGMVMTMAQRPLGGGTFGVRAMLSPDPLMGAKGYPLLLAAGETADGSSTLLDRQHPHDLFMELSASYSHPVGSGSAFLYVGLPGEPAIGPPAFMHRAAAMDSPEAPISHHWLDSTHITFGVVTAGYTYDRWRIEGSVFRGREPDEHRYDIETGSLDSYSARLSFNPTNHWALQVSAARINSPESLEPDEDQRRVTASALYSRGLVGGGRLSATFAWGRKTHLPGGSTDAWLVEGAWAADDHWTLFIRAEQIGADELLGHVGGAFTVRKVSVGAIYDVRLSQNVKLGLGGLVSGFDIPDPLKATYGAPSGAMGFVRLKIG